MQIISLGLLGAMIYLLMLEYLTKITKDSIICVVK
jgi:hypothetical protein